MQTTPWFMVLPFAVLLLAIAILPLVPGLNHWWHKNSSKLLVSGFLGSITVFWVILNNHTASLFHAGHEYISFIALIGSLFVVSGGIFLSGDIRATPRNNTFFLCVGGVVASFIGTTGAAMLLIRPLLNTNRERQLKVHTVVFAIFIVANCGGLLTPLGDPPLFLGMLRGVPFTWTFNLLFEWLFVNGMLLLAYYALDREAYFKESPQSIRWDNVAVTKLGLIGKENFVWLAVIILAVAFTASPWRELLMVFSAGASLLRGDKGVRYGFNKFTWDPILEVAALFVGIFATMIPALMYLAQIAPSLPLNEITLFLFTGGLSAVLDNAPTYATFFEMARQLPGDVRIAGVPELYLVSISLGAVFCGAITYIGNGPNFMVKAVAESVGVKMPTFGGYVFWALKELVPVLLVMMMIFISQSSQIRIFGGLIAAALVARSLQIIRKNKRTSQFEIISRAA